MNCSSGSQPAPASEGGGGNKAQAGSAGVDIAAAVRIGSACRSERRVGEGVISGADGFIAGSVGARGARSIDGLIRLKINHGSVTALIVSTRHQPQACQRVIQMKIWCTKERV